MIKCPKYSIFW